MYYKNFNILIQYQFGKLFFINYFDLPKNWQSLDNGIKLFNKLLISKYNIYIAKK